MKNFNTPNNDEYCNKLLKKKEENPLLYKIIVILKKRKLNKKNSTNSLAKINNPNFNYVSYCFKINIKN